MDEIIIDQIDKSIGGFPRHLWMAQSGSTTNMKINSTSSNNGKVESFPY